jgi:hypothetical protein
MTDVVLKDGSVVDNYSAEYRMYCEAKWLLTKDIEYRREWLSRMQERRPEEVLKVKGYLTILFKN